MWQLSPALAFCLLFLFGPLPAATADDSPALTVKVRGADGKAAPDVRVEIQTFPNLTISAGGVTDKDGGVAATDSGGKKLPTDTYAIIATLPNGLYLTRIVYVGGGGTVEVALDPATLLDESVFSDDVYGTAEAAKASGDVAAYENAASYLRRYIAQRERLVDEAQAAADAFARDRGLRVAGLAGARKDLKKVEQLGNRADPQVKRDLEAYIGKLAAVDLLRQELTDKKKRFAELEERKFSLGLPSTCPEGQSGGLLAGAVNSVLGSDLAGICGEQPSNRRDTERNRDQEGEHEGEHHD